jgi:hypothetical protein
MNKKLRILALVISLCLPAFAYAGVVYLPVHLNEKRGEFASPVGVFNSNNNIAFHGEFRTQGLLPKESFLSQAHTDDLKSSSVIFAKRNNEFRNTDSILKTPKGEFSSNGLITKSTRSEVEKQAFKSPDQGEFKFSLP